MLGGGRAQEEIIHIAEDKCIFSTCFTSSPSSVLPLTLHPPPQLVFLRPAAFPSLLPAPNALLSGSLT